jgi:hypothetical protein
MVANAVAEKLRLGAILLNGELETRLYSSRAVDRHNDLGRLLTLFCALMFG